MGSALACGRCPTAETSSVVNLSDALVLRIVDGVEVPQPKSCVLPPAEDEEWLEKLKCIDEAHSSAYGLTFKDLSRLLVMVDRRVKEGAPIKHCASVDVLQGCYRFNKECSLKCRSEVDEFISCVDAKRYYRLKLLFEKIQERERELKKLKLKKMRKEQMKQMKK